MKSLPPYWILFLLRKICHEDLLEAVEGDLIQLFNHRLAKLGKPFASLLLLFDILQFIQPFSFRTPQYYRMIIKNYLTIISRNMIRKKVITIINIAGMTLALTLSMVIYSYVVHERSYDRFHEKSDRIYRMSYRYQNENTGYDIHWARMNGKWFNSLPDEFSEISKLVRFQSFRERDVLVGEEKYREQHAFAVDQEAFSVFNYTFINGDAKSALSSPYSVVLTKSTASRYFGNSNPIGKKLQISADNGQQESYTVTAIIKDVPSNTHMPVTLFTGINKPEDRKGWAYTYVLLEEQSTIKSVADKMPSFLDRMNTYSEGESLSVHFMPLTDIHLQSNLSREIVVGGNHQYILGFITVAIFLLFIATINFANLNTVQSFGRSREMGLRKVMGAQISQFKMYFFVEALMLAGISAIIAAIIFFFTRPYLENFVGYHFVFDSYSLVLWTLLIVTVVTIISGAISGQLVTKINTIEALKGKSISNNVRPIKNLLIGFQFALAIILVSCTIIFHRQFTFIQNHDLGYNKAHIMAFTGNSFQVMRSYELLKERLEKITGVKAVSALSEMPSIPIKDMGQIAVVDYPEIDISADMLNMDVNGTDIMDIKLLAGNPLPARLKQRAEFPELNNFEQIRAYVMAQRRSYMINKSAMNAMGWQSPEEAIGNQMSWSIGNIKLKKGLIVGVIDDFHQESLYAKIDPLVITYEPVWFRHVMIKTSSENSFEMHNALESAWNDIFPNQPMELVYLDQKYEQLYKLEQKQLQLISVFTAVAIFIAFLGLYGMIEFALKNRTKELAIRRVLGSDIIQIMKLIGKEYFTLASISLVIIIPIVWKLMSVWLDNYAYRININGVSFLLASLTLIIILGVSLFLHIYKSGRVNPVEALRGE